jgi:hypothetical protein
VGSRRIIEKGGKQKIVVNDDGISILSIHTILQLDGRTRERRRYITVLTALILSTYLLVCFQARGSMI